MCRGRTPGRPEKKEGKQMSEEKKENLEEKEVVENKEKSNLEQELEETTDRMKRIMAEFENYKKRSAKEREMLYNTLLGDIISSFLPIMDNLEKAALAKTEDEGYRQGIELLLKQFKDTFKNLGVEEIETVGKTFDPELHEAVASVVDESLGEKEIKEEYRKGYKIGTRVIRHSMVVVAN